MKRYKFTATVVNHSLEFDEPVETPKQDQKEQLLPKVQDEPLPIAKYRDKILKKIKDSFVTIISAGTGSGKTTQVPQYILDDAIQRKEPCRILITQPRKIGCVTIAKRVSLERGTELGGVVGYQIGLKKKANLDEQTRLLFCTTGVVLEKLIAQKNMNDYTHIILDEIHEREVDMDLLMVIVRELLIKNSAETKIVLMSATANIQSFFDYFTLQNSEAPGVDYCPALVKHKADRNFNIEKLYLDDLRMFDDIDRSRPGISSKMYESAKRIIISRLKQSQKSILVFLPGIYEIQMLHSRLRDDPEIANACLICVLHSSLSTEEQRVAFLEASKPKVVLSTNIAESSITITGPEVDCVIDFCLSKSLVASKETTIAQLKLEWASQSSLEQRAGRTGRTCDGVVFRLVNRRFYDLLLPQTVPEMEKCPLESVVLRVKLLEYLPPMDLLPKAMNPPEGERIIHAVLLLKELGGLQRLENDRRFDSTNGALTYIGRIMAALPIDIRITKFIIIGYFFSVLDEAIIIGAGLNIKSIFRSSYQKKLDDYCHKLAWANGSGDDFIAILSAYKLWVHMTEQGHFSTWQDEKNWCDKFNLERKSLREMRLLVNEITNRLKDYNIETLSGEFATKWEDKVKPLILKICVAGAFIPNYFISGELTELMQHDVYKRLGGKDPLSSVMFRIKGPKDLIGEIYERQLKEKMVASGICSNIDDIKVTFDRGSAKIFVEFTKNSMVDVDDYDGKNIALSHSSQLKPLILGRISSEVYKAVKLRKLGHKFTLDVMDPSDAEKYALKWLIGTKEDGYFELYKRYMKHPGWCVLPLTCDEKLSGIVTEILHCGKFYIQPTADQNTNVLVDIHEKLNKEMLPRCPIPSALKPNKIVAVNDEYLKRAKVVEVSKNDDRTATCLLFDFGKTVTVSLDDIYLIPKGTMHLFEIPEQCFEASLSKIEPSFIKCPRGKWTPKAVNTFRKLALDHECVVEVYSVVEDVASVKLLVDNIDVNKFLIKSGFAQEGEESYPSHMDHEIRKRNQTSNNGRYEADIEFKYKVDTIYKTQIDPPQLVECKKSLPLSGPESPLETSISRVLMQPNHREIIIDPQSVNSITLIDDPGNIHGRLIVAANITQSESGIVIHETAAMPPIPGLPVVLAMIFAPDVIFRRSADRTRYENIQFGLGADPRTKKAYFPEHDCILPVNFDLDLDDFLQVKILRETMNCLVLTQQTETIPSLKPKEKYDLLLRAKEKIIRILQKNRSPLPLTYASHDFGDWTTEDQSDSYAREDRLKIFNCYYHELTIPPLYPEDPEKIEKLLKQLSLMEDEMSVRAQGAINTIKSWVCQLCDRNFEDKFSLQIHFNSNMHLSRRQGLEKKLRAKKPTAQ